MKWIKHNLASIDGVDIHPIISIVAFFTVFTVMLIIGVKMKKKDITEIEKFPLED